MQPNLYARIARGIVLELRMPAPDGTLDAPAPRGEEWFAITWPVNPHDTGEKRIASIIEGGWHTTRWAAGEDAHA